ncbi:MAG: VOC family protein [Labilithrix sp.]|nr:VOC family protein [Labilithrix sp.]
MKTTTETMHPPHPRLRALACLAMTTLLAACARAPGSSAARDARAPANQTNEARAMTPESTMPVTWFSLPADDVEKATSFYRHAFGWQIEPRTREADDVYDYNVVVSSASDRDFNPSQPGRVNGCIVKRATGITTPVVLIEVPDLDEAARKVVAAGGTVVSAEIPMRSLNGSFILVKDPEGNMLELFRSGAP